MGKLTSCQRRCWRCTVVLYYAGAAAIDMRRNPFRNPFDGILQHINLLCRCLCSLGRNAIRPDTRIARLPLFCCRTAS